MNMQPANTPEQNTERYGARCHGSIGERSSVYQDERITDGYLTLGGLIDFLRTVDEHTPVVTDTGHTLTHPHSYRVYYVDLAFMPTHEPQNALDLLALAVGCVGQEYPAWKGGGYIKMNLNTPVWVAREGEGGRYVSAVRFDAGIVTLVTASEYDED
jgi:hypothetical protein